MDKLEGWSWPTPRSSASPDGSASPNVVTIDRSDFGRYWQRGIGHFTIAS